MGSDIYAHVEYQPRVQEDSNNWWWFATVNIPRDYILFGRMAGIRGDGDPVVEARGFPDNPSIAVGHAYQESGEYFASWLTYAEFSQALSLAMDDPRHVWTPIDKPHQREEVKAILKAMQSLENDGYVTRLVFWFD